jgi:hypothetical protein
VVAVARVTVPWVRIPPSPPIFWKSPLFFKDFELDQVPVGAYVTGEEIRSFKGYYRVSAGKLYGFEPLESNISLRLPEPYRRSLADRPKRNGRDDNREDRSRRVVQLFFSLVWARALTDRLKNVQSYLRVTGCARAQTV